ncbi:unnamed protein product [Linum tenue]|uniref:Uncharacterized protein n=4 Tax=Linum tenue TaxID=586396 RepID=A0AAV0QJN6_9ROSI|nr:unnamed protein product [Linum tenue]
MVLPKTLVTLMVSKLRKIAVTRRMGNSVSSSLLSASFSSDDRRGYFVVYTVDKTRYVLPLKYLKSEVVMEILRMSEEEFGFSTDKPIVLPFNTTVMDQIISLLSSQQDGDGGIEQVPINDIATAKGCSSLNQSSFIAHHHSCESLCAQ